MFSLGRESKSVLLPLSCVCKFLGDLADLGSVGLRLALTFYTFFNVYLFIFERERMRMQAGEGQRERERENPKRTLGCQPRGQHGAQTQEL